MEETDYKILGSRSVLVLEEGIKDFMKDGYIPVGGVTIDPNGEFIQAIYKTPDKEGGGEL